jgi:hypothetical protein
MTSFTPKSKAKNFGPFTLHRPALFAVGSNEVQFDFEGIKKAILYSKNKSLF